MTTYTPVATRTFTVAPVGDHPVHRARLFLPNGVANPEGHPVLAYNILDNVQDSVLPDTIDEDYPELHSALEAHWAVLAISGPVARGHDTGNTEDTVAFDPVNNLYGDAYRGNGCSWAPSLGPPSGIPTGVHPMADPLWFSPIKSFPMALQYLAYSLAAEFNLDLTRVAPGGASAGSLGPLSVLFGPDRAPQMTPGGTGQNAINTRSIVRVAAVERAQTFGPVFQQTGAGWFFPQVPGTASGYKVNQVGGVAIGQTVIPVDTGTGTFIPGDYLVLQGSSQRPRVQQGIVSGHITIDEPLTVALADNANVTVVKTWDWPSHPISAGDQTNLFEMAPLVMFDDASVVADNLANRKVWMRYAAAGTAGAPFDKTHLTHDETNVHGVWSGRALKQRYMDGGHPENCRLIVSDPAAANGIHEDAVITDEDAVYADRMAFLNDALDFEWVGDSTPPPPPPEIGWYTRLDKTLKGAVGTSVQGPLGVTVVYDNQNEPVAQNVGSWARVKIDYQDSQQTHFGATPKYRRSGDLVAECRCRLAAGDAGAYALADAFVTAFRGAVVDGDARVVFRTPRTDGARREDAWWLVTARLPWYCDEDVDESPEGDTGAVGTLSEVAEALRTRFQDHVEQTLGLPTQYDDAPFSPALGAPWARFTVLPGSQQYTEGSETLRCQQVGVAVAQVFVPAGVGQGAALAIVDTIDEAFRSTEDTGVILHEPRLRTVGRGGAWWQMNVVLPFTALIGPPEAPAPSIYPTGTLYEPPAGMVLYGLAQYPSHAADYVEALSDFGGGGGGGGGSDFLPLTIAVEKLMPSGIAAWADTMTTATFSVFLPDQLVGEVGGRPALSLSGSSTWQCRTLQRWRSGFVKVAIFRAQVNPGVTPTLAVSAGGTGSSGGADLMSVAGGVWTLNTGAVVATVKVPAFNLLDTVKIGAQTIVSAGSTPGIIGAAADGTTLIVRPNAVARVDENGPAQGVLRIDGELAKATASTVTIARFMCRFTVQAGSPDVKVTFTVLNDKQHLNASPATNDNNHLQLGWIDIGCRMTIGASPQIVCCNPATETVHALGGVGQPTDIYCYQKYSNALTTDVGGVGGAYKPHITKDGGGVFTQQGWDRVHDAGGGSSLSNDPALFPRHGYLNLSGASAGCTIAIRHMPHFWPGSLEANSNGTVRIGLFSRFNPDKFVFPWRMHESREAVLSFHVGPVGALPSTSLPLQVAKRLDFPLFGRCADYSKYDASGVFPYRLVTIEQQRQALEAMGITHTPSVANEQMQVQRFRAASTTGGENNKAAGEQRLLDEFLRHGCGGQLYRAIDFAVYLAEWARPRSADFTHLTDPGALNDGTLDHTTATFDDTNNDQHLYDDDIIAAYYLTGDERLPLALVDEADVLASVSFSTNGNERGHYQWIRSSTLVIDFLIGPLPTIATPLLTALKARLAAQSATTVDVDAVTTGSGWDSLTPGAGTRGYYASDTQNLGDKLPGEHFVARGFVSARLGPIAYKFAQLNLTLADADGVKAQGRKKDLCKFTKNELLRTATGPHVPAGMAGQKCLIKSYQIHLQTPGADEPGVPDGFEHPNEHSVCTAGAEGFRETGDTAYLDMAVAHIVAFNADGHIDALDSGLEMQDFVSAYLEATVEPGSAPPDHLPGIVAYIYNIGENGHPPPDQAEIVATLQDLDDLGYLPRLGVTLADFVSPTTVGIDDVLATSTTYDDQIAVLVAALVEFGEPCLLAIAWECNGGAVPYHVASYKQAFQKIVTAVRDGFGGADQCPVAFVWGIEAAAAINFDDWYPGDNFVHWCAFDGFKKGVYWTPGQPAYVNADALCTFAEEHSKRVIILEASCVGTDLPSGEIPPDPASGVATWAFYFVPVFAFVAARPIIGAIEYVDQDWTSTAYHNSPTFWGNALLQSNTDVFASWIAEISLPKYIDSSQRSLLLHWSENHS